MSSANARQVGGEHYKKENGVQHWDLTVQFLCNRYLEGQISRYVDRHRRKAGRQDLEKAVHYVDKLIEEFAAERVSPIGDEVRSSRQWQMFENFLSEKTPVECLLFRAIGNWDTAMDLRHLRDALEIYTDQQYPK